MDLEFKQSLEKRIYYIEKTYDSIRNEKILPAIIELKNTFERLQSLKDFNSDNYKEIVKNWKELDKELQTSFGYIHKLCDEIELKKHIVINEFYYDTRYDDWSNEIIERINDILSATEDLYRNKYPILFMKHIDNIIELFKKNIELVNNNKYDGYDINDINMNIKKIKAYKSKVDQNGNETDRHVHKSISNYIKDIRKNFSTYFDNMMDICLTYIKKTDDKTNELLLPYNLKVVYEEDENGKRTGVLYRL